MMGTRTRKRGDRGRRRTEGRIERGGGDGGEPVHARYFYRLKRRHAQHHHVDGGRNFGVTTGFWDRIFGTVATKRPPRPGMTRQPYASKVALPLAFRMSGPANEISPDTGSERWTHHKLQAFSDAGAARPRRLSVGPGGLPDDRGQRDVTPLRYGRRKSWRHSLCQRTRTAEAYDHFAVSGADHWYEGAAKKVKELIGLLRSILLRSWSWGKPRAHRYWPPRINGNDNNSGHLNRWWRSGR